MNKLQWTKEELWQGCKLASIAHAVMTAHYPDFAHEQSWERTTYNVQDSQGTRGAVTFSGSYCVAAFRDDNSERLDDDREALDFFSGAPSEVIKLAQEETLQYLLDSINGSVKPSITAAFWSNGTSLYSHDNADTLFENGVFLLEKQFLYIESVSQNVSLSKNCA